jgi:hypothetical protein
MNQKFFLNIRVSEELGFKLEEIRVLKSQEWGITLKKKDTIVFLLQAAIKQIESNRKLQESTSV